MNQRHDYIEAIQMTKTRLPFRLRASILRDLVAHVTSFALHKIIEQYNLITIIEESLLRCINVFTRTLNLSCAHKIQRRMYDTAEDEGLKIEDIHSHWRFEDSAVSSPIDSSEVTSEVTSEATSETTSETFDAEMNYDIFTFFLSNLSDSLLQVQNLAVVRSKNKFVKARERRGVKRQQEFESSTQRKSFRYEHVLTEAEQ